MKKTIKKVDEEIELPVDTKKEISKLTTVFPNVDLNKLVEKINELIDKSNGSI